MIKQKLIQEMTDIIKVEPINWNLLFKKYNIYEGLTNE